MKKNRYRFYFQDNFYFRDNDEVQTTIIHATSSEQAMSKFKEQHGGNVTITHWHIIAELFQKSIPRNKRKS